MSKQQSNFTLLQLYPPLKQERRKENGKEAINATCQIRGVRGSQTGGKKYGKKGGMTGKKLSKETQLITSETKECSFQAAALNSALPSKTARFLHISVHTALLTQISSLLSPIWSHCKSRLFSSLSPAGRYLPSPPPKIWCSLLRFPAGKPGTDKWPLGAPTDEQSHRLTL